MCYRDGRLGDGVRQALKFVVLPGQTLFRIAAGYPVLVDNAGRINIVPIRMAFGTPSAAFLRDTLCVLWTDRRNGGYDIYGGILPGVRKAGVREEGEGRHRNPRARIIPAPARDRATLQLELCTGGPLQLDLVDMWGTLVRTERLETHDGAVAHELELEDLPSGWYLLHYRSGDGTGWLPLQVVR